MGSMGRIDVNASTYGVKQTVAKKDVRSQIKSFVKAQGTVEQKKARLVEYLNKQKKALTYKFTGNTLTVKTLGEFATEYTFDIVAS